MAIHLQEWGSNPEPHDRCVPVFDGEIYDGDWPPEDADGFLAWFKNKIATVPEEHRGGVKIELDSRGGYEDSHYASIAIVYWRKETPDETAMRLREWEQKKARHIANARAEYERLKATFGE